MRQCNSFAPVADANARVLLLGSMPGKKSLAMGQYYAHPQNRFWHLMALILNVPVPGTYREKLALLQKNGIALWDVLASCERGSSLDSDIKNEIPNDICGLAASLPRLQAVFCNGGKAAAAFKKYFASGLPPEIAVWYLPSTSPANAGMDLETLWYKWRVLAQYTAQAKAVQR